MKVVILGAGHYLPAEILTNQFFVNQNPLYEYTKEGEYINPVDTTDAWIQEMMGPKERRRAAKGEEVHHMAAKAVNSALANAKMRPDDLEGIVVATVTQDKQFPSAACLKQELVGARNIGYALDVGSACAGFTTAIAVANAMILQYGLGPFAVVGAEKLSRMVDYKDKNSPLFGDGAGAVILGRTEDNQRGIMWVKGKSNPHDGRKEWIYRDEHGYLRMPCGSEVLKEATRELTHVCQEGLSASRTPSGAKWDDEGILDLGIFHQANIRILQGVQRRLRLTDEQVFKNIERYGNMSSASAAVALSEAYEQGRIKEGSRVIMACIGSGMVTSAVALVA